MRYEEIWRAEIGPRANVSSLSDLHGYVVSAEERSTLAAEVNRLKGL